MIPAKSEHVSTVGRAWPPYLQRIISTKSANYHVLVLADAFAFSASLPSCTAISLHSKKRREKTFLDRINALGRR